MGPADHVTTPSGSSEPCNCRHFRVPDARMRGKYQAGASYVSELRGSLRRERPADHVTNPSGSSELCICHHFWAPKPEYGGKS